MEFESSEKLQMVYETLKISGDGATDHISQVYL